MNRRTDKSQVWDSFATNENVQVIFQNLDLFAFGVQLDSSVKIIGLDDFAHQPLITAACDCDVFGEQFVSSTRLVLQSWCGRCRIGVLDVGVHAIQIGAQALGNHRLFGCDCADIHAA